MRTTETFFRGYDPLAGALASYSPYNFALNNPVYYNDPMGDYVEPILRPELPPTSAFDRLGAGGKGGFDNIVSGLFGSEVVPGHMGPMPGYTGTVYIDIGGYTLEIDWSKVTSDGVSINFTDNGIVVGDINLGEGNDGFWIDFPYGPGKGDIVSQSYKSIYVKGAKSSVFAHQGGQVQQDPGWDLNNDGTLSLSEANNWYRVGNGQPIAIPLSTLDLTSVHVVDFRKGVGSTKSFSLFINSSSYNDMLVFGSITLRLYPDNMVRAFSDTYDFDQRNGLNPLNWPRNAATAIGEWVAGDGIPFQIHLTGSAYITHESTRVNK